MRAASPVISLSFAGCLLAAAPAQGMGFGRVVNGTQLGQPLDFSAVVKLDADETLARECVFAEVASGDNRISPGLVRVTLTGAPGEAERAVHVSTSTPIDEPVVTVNVTLGCTSRVTRQFVAFVDPPGLALAPSAGTSATPVPPSAPPFVDERPPREQRVAADVPAPRRGTDPRAATGRVAAPAEPPRRRAAPVRALAANGPRLQLDAPAVAAPAAAASVEAPTPAIAAAASAPAEQADALAREQMRIRALEDQITAMQAEAKAQREALASLQLRVGSRPSQRYANPLVYTLAALCLLLTTLVSALLGRRSRDRAVSRWLTSTMLAKSIEPAATPAVAAPAALSVPVAAPAPPDRAVVAAAPQTPVPAATQAAPRALSVEELIDLEQQADFFAVLGQEDAAIELLNGHAALDDRLSSPMPLLKLLELHQRVGDRAEYDRMRTRIGRHFNARTPDFDADPVHGRTLDDHPAVIARLQAAWPAPARALEALDALVFRREPSDEAFDLPAFRELMFLRAVAVDNVGHPVAAIDRLAVDEQVASADPRRPAAPASWTLDVDLTRAPSRPPATPSPPSGRRLPVLTAAASQFDGTETVPSALRRAPGFANESTFVDLELDLPALATESAGPR